MILASPPEEDQKRELWLQHAAGMILFQNMKTHAIDGISDNTSEETRKKIIKGIDDSIYGLMMMMDGVCGTLENEEYLVRIDSKIILQKKGETVLEINTMDSDGMCMGFHGWKENDFGEDPVIKKME